MTTIDARRKNVKGRLRWLGAALLLLAAAFLAREINPILPHEPRLILEDAFGEELGRLAVVSHCGQDGRGRLDVRLNVRGSLRPRPDCDYAFVLGLVRGRDLVKAFEAAKRRNQDVVIMVHMGGRVEIAAR